MLPVRFGGMGFLAVMKNRLHRWKIGYFCDKINKIICEVERGGDHGTNQSADLAS